MGDTKEKIVNELGIVLGSVVVLVLLGLVIAFGLLVSGLVLSIMWGWFLTPLGLSTITVTHAVGIALLIRYLTWQHSSKKEKESNNTQVLNQIIIGFIYPFGVLGLGWIIHSFM